ncbi:MAG: gliding motility-associated C-terminal domain-containing protein [Bacteroidia bacterium]|nr:gliding motility-associated C-terminal domain-containing protein [Bacteroidia bacterium]
MSPLALGQLFVNTGAQFTTTAGGMVTVLDMDAINEGQIDHAGDLEVRGNIINKKTWLCDNTVANRTSLTLDWTNDDLFYAGIGTVHFSGSNQLIQGIQPSAFYNLVLHGNIGNTKTQLSHSGAKNTLDLGNVELATNGFTFTLWNAQNPVIRKSGYISTFKDGIVRAEYPSAFIGNTTIPLGFGTKASEYKPFYLINSAADSFDITLYGHSASLDAKDVLSIADTVCKVNPFYYYKHRSYASPSFYALGRSADEMGYSKIGRWTGSQWDRIVASGPNTTLPFNNLAFQSQPAFLTEDVTHVSEKPYVDAGPSISVLPRESKQLLASGYFPGNTKTAWSPSTDLSCITCLDPYFRMGSPGLLFITADNGSGCLATDSLLITLEGDNIYIGNAFSPNGDNLNEGFGPVLGRNDKLTQMQVYNRWGEKLYEGNAPWNGYYKGEVVMEGVYIYKILVTRDLGRNVIQNFNLEGSFTLLR